MDKILTGKYTAIPCFAGIMALVFWLTFSVIGKGLSDVLDMGISSLTNAVDQLLTAWNVNDVLHSLVIDGIFNGVGSVLSFLPVIVTLFFFLSLLEDSGYMARVAFVMDKLLRKIGLSGRSIVPMLVGFGCTVPGVMASRTLPSERDRKDDHSSYSVYELLCKASDLCILYSSIFPEIWGTCNGGTLFWRNSDGNSDGVDFRQNPVQGRGSALCNGASELPSSGSEKCRAAALGKSKGFPAESLYGYLCGNNCNLVLTDL